MTTNTVTSVNTSGGCRRFEVVAVGKNGLGLIRRRARPTNTAKTTNSNRGNMTSVASGKNTGADTNLNAKTEAGTVANTATTDNDSPSAPFIAILAWLNYMTFDVIFTLAFCRAFEMLEGEGQLNEMDDADLNENLGRDLQPEERNSLAYQRNTDTPHPSKHGSELLESR
ncbi:hypothetical protein JB92DRAFT_2837146 [Gautieria morchelliformis]|nr:hypothetical protein JB92DRAFT_2837146 [Gautieria morchelliformis]